MAGTCHWRLRRICVIDSWLKEWTITHLELNVQMKRRLYMCINTHAVWSSHEVLWAVVLCSLIVSFLSQTGWLALSPWFVGGPMVMNVFSFLWSPLYCYSMPGRMKNRLKRQETDTERMFGCWLLSYQPFSHLMKQLSALQLIKYPPVTGQSCRVARPWESYIRF